MRITPEVIEVGGFDAVELLSPEAYPISPTLYEATARQADAMIIAERQGIIDQYKEEQNEFKIIDSWEWQNKNYLTAIRVGIQYRLYENLQARSDFGRFVKDGTITQRTRHSLFCYRPDYDVADDQTMFTYPHELAGDLQRYYHGVKREWLQHLGSCALDDENFDGYPEYDTEYVRLGEIIDALSEISGDDMPAVSTPAQKREGTLLNYARNWRDALFVR